MNAVDTNVLLYVHDPRDAAKQATASNLLQSVSDGVLLWQVACEYLAASRKLVPFGYNLAQAYQDVRDLQRIWFTLLPSWSTLDRAERLVNNYSLSFWDAMIIAACLEAGVTRLYSEDFDAYAHVDGLQLVNPFRAVATS
jgi:predicted nucleic acid-binding protein